MNICDVEQCTGCAACVNTCPNNCISMKSDGGFLFPEIDESKCVKCKLCVAACPNVNCVEKHSEPKAYICSYTDSEAIRRSSSGALAYALALAFLSRGGVVFGAAYDEKMHVSHIRVEQESQLPRLQGSKYAQSEMGMAIREARDCLESGKEVLFFGTPCQIAGLLTAIPQKLQSKLYACDILCGGIPSPGVFEKYIHYLSRKYQACISDINFRSKKYGYSYGYLHEVQLSNGESITLSGSDSAFVKSIGCGYVRQSCFFCKYVDTNRISDITLGDFSKEAKNNEMGVSSVLVNTEKGNELLSLISDVVNINDSSVFDISASQVGALMKTRTRPENYDSFLNAADNCTWEEIYNKFFKPRSIRNKVIEKIPPYWTSKIRRVLR